MTNKTPISGSEVNTALLCERKAMYAFHPGYHLEPKSLGPAITRGIIGHKALELFYKEVQETEDWDTAAQNSLNKLMSASLKYIADGDSAKAEMISGLAVLLDDYYKRYRDIDEFEILGVEELVEGDLPSPTASFIGRVDLTIKMKRGPWKGEVSPFDHKFVYNFWPDGAFMVNSQMPNYVWGVRNKYTKAVVKRAIINQLRHRKDAVEKFNRRDIVPSRMEIEELVNNHSRAASRWVVIKNMDVEDAKKTVLRNPSKFNCEYCPFIRLCRNELIGEDTTLMLKTEFKPNSYGYAQRDDG